MPRGAATLSRPPRIPATPGHATRTLRIEFGSRDRAAAVMRALHDERRVVFIGEQQLWCGCLVVAPTNLTDAEEGLLVAALAKVVSSG